MLTKNKQQDAGVMFELGGYLEEALAAFNQALSWQDSIVCVQNFKVEVSFKTKKLKSFATKFCWFFFV